MQISCIQFAPEFGNLTSNVNRIEQWLSDSDADVVVFPELCTSGYFFHSKQEAKPYALSVNSSIIEHIVNVCIANEIVAVIGFAEQSAEDLFNSALICGYNIPTTVYRKTHLFYRETDVFTPGNSGFGVVHIPHIDCRLGTMICYDWRFPEASRTLALSGADLIACPSNLITHIWKMAMPVRALENKVYLAVANRIGSEENGVEQVSFNGQSTVYGFNGSVLAAADATTESTIFADIDPVLTRNKSFNAYNNIFSDRRPDYYT